MGSTLCSLKQGRRGNSLLVSVRKRLNDDKCEQETHF